MLIKKKNYICVCLEKIEWNTALPITLLYLNRFSFFF